LPLAVSSSLQSPYLVCSQLKIDVWCNKVFATNRVVNSPLSSFQVLELPLQHVLHFINFLLCSAAVNISLSIAANVEINWEKYGKENILVNFHVLSGVCIM
jgi:hypothetical protein